MANEEYLVKLMELEQETNRLEQQMQVIEQQSVELQNIHLGLQELNESKEKEMFADFGKNIFIKTEIKDKNLLVDVGNKIFIKKTIPETQKVIEAQQLKIIEAKNRILTRMQEIQHQMEDIIAEAEKNKD